LGLLLPKVWVTSPGSLKNLAKEKVSATVINGVLQGSGIAGVIRQLCCTIKSMGSMEASKALAPEQSVKQ